MSSSSNDDVNDADPVLDEKKKKENKEKKVDDTIKGKQGKQGKQPPPEKPAEIRRRSLIILSFWLIVLFLGLPIWWKTTSIYRANLPLKEMMDWADGKVINWISWISWIPWLFLAFLTFLTFAGL